MGNLLDLARSMDNKSNMLKLASSRLAVDMANAIVANLATVTPVDTSEALSNWVVTLNDPASSAIPAYNLGKYGSTASASAAQTISSGRKVLESKTPGQPIYITNNAPYIVELNNGSSKQSPGGFVERAVSIGRAMKSNFKMDK